MSTVSAPSSQTTASPDELELDVSSSADIALRSKSVSLGSLNFSDLHEAYVAELGREDELANQRTNWLLASQTFLVAAYAGTVVASISAGSSGHPALLYALLVIVGVVGVVTSRLFGLSISAASDAWNMWHFRYVQHAKEAIESGTVRLDWLPWYDRAADPWPQDPYVPFWKIHRWGALPEKYKEHSDGIDRKGGLAQRWLAPPLFWMWFGLMAFAALCFLGVGPI